MQDPVDETRIEKRKNRTHRTSQSPVHSGSMRSCEEVDAFAEGRRLSCRRSRLSWAMVVSKSFIRPVGLYMGVIRRRVKRQEIERRDELENFFLAVQRSVSSMAPISCVLWNASTLYGRKRVRLTSSE